MPRGRLAAGRSRVKARPLSVGGVAQRFAQGNQLLLMQFLEMLRIRLLNVHGAMATHAEPGRVPRLWHETVRPGLSNRGRAGSVRVGRPRERCVGRRRRQRCRRAVGRSFGGQRRSLRPREICQRRPRALTSSHRTTQRAIRAGRAFKEGRDHGGLAPGDKMRSTRRAGMVGSRFRAHVPPDASAALGARTSCSWPGGCHVARRARSVGTRARGRAADRARIERAPVHRGTNTGIVSVDRRNLAKQYSKRLDFQTQIREGKKKAKEAEEAGHGCEAPA